MLEKYAELIVKQGVNLQKGQELVITASIECFELVRAVARQAFAVGAKDVIVDYTMRKLPDYAMRIVLLNIFRKFRYILLNSRINMP